MTIGSKEKTIILNWPFTNIYARAQSHDSGIKKPTNPQKSGPLRVALI